jgi:hypothetical protein
LIVAIGLDPVVHSGVQQISETSTRRMSAWIAGEDGAARLAPGNDDVRNRSRGASGPSSGYDDAR